MALYWHDGLNVLGADVWVVGKQDPPRCQILDLKWRPKTASKKGGPKIESKKRAQNGDFKNCIKEWHLKRRLKIA